MRRLADGAAVLDKVDVEAVGVLGPHRFFQHGVGCLRGQLLPDEAQALRQPVDMGVHGDAGHAEGEQQHTAGRLRPHPVQACQPLQRILEGERLQERQVEVPPARADLLQDRLDAGRLLHRETAGADALHYLLDAGIRDPLPAAEGLPELPEGALCVEVGGVLSQHRLDQLNQRLVPAVPGARSVVVRQPLDHASGVVGQDSSFLIRAA